MCRAMNATRHFGLAVGIGAGLLFCTQPGYAQAQPSDVPRNLLSPAIPYEQGIANIRAQGATRPQAVRPKRAGDDAASPHLPATPPVPRPQ